MLRTTLYQKTRNVPYYRLCWDQKRLLKLLVSLRKLKELQFTELVDLAMKPFNPQAIPIIKRFDVNSNSQKEGELIGVYLAELYIK